MKPTSNAKPKPSFAKVDGESWSDTPKDLFIPPEALLVYLKRFEGPLDLLLYLIRKRKLTIDVLAISQITAQYLNYIHAMQEMDMDLAAEYLLMAALLTQIKSNSLLPKLAEIEQDPEEIQLNLIRQLQAYELYKKAAEDLDGVARVERDWFTASLEFVQNDVDEQQSQVLDIQRLSQCMQSILQRLDHQQHHQIKAETFSIRRKMDYVLSRLDQEPSLSFEQLLLLDEGRMGVIVTFISILELLKLRKVSCCHASNPSTGSQLLLQLLGAPHAQQRA
ncbi:segregation and condensation protein A [Alginatibacterium sediminis]|uniref:segregation and condensation protein A n=1 Tax=Alginatibacterium sediminis TaxID=2164068 RepID=UPI001314A7A5|nr:segregation/condensation protein A [Alginatibacterium sediminis]